MFRTRPSRQEMYADDAKFLWKLILRSLAIVLAIVGIGLIGWSLAHQVVFPDNIYDGYENAYYDWPYDTDTWYLPWELITLGLSVIWNAANVIVLLTRNRPIHPGANVACDLLLWLGLGVTGIFAIVGAENYFYWYPNDFDDSASYTTYPNGTDTFNTFNPCQGFTSCAAQQSYNSAVSRKAVTIAVGAGTGFVVLLMHFALFVSACRYTNARRVTVLAGAVAEKMHRERDGAGRQEEERNPNAGFVPISEPVEQQAPLDYGMPPAPTGMTVGDRGKRRAVLEGGERGPGTRRSCEQPEVVVVDGGDGERGLTGRGDGV